MALPWLGLAQEPGIPAALMTASSCCSFNDSVSAVKVTAGAFQAMSLARFDANGNWITKGEYQHLIRTSVFVSIKRPLGKYFEAGFCLPWYRSSIQYSGKSYQTGTYSIEKISDIRLFLGFHTHWHSTSLSLEGGTNIPIGNGLPTAFHPAFPPGENGYLTFWVKGQANLKLSHQWVLYTSSSLDMIAPRSGAILDRSLFAGFITQTDEVVQATIKPGNRIVFSAGVGKHLRQWSFGGGYSLFYQFPTSAENIYPVNDNNLALAAAISPSRRVLHTAHAVAFRRWNRFGTSLMIQGAAGGFNAWGEWLTALAISFNL